MGFLMVYAVARGVVGATHRPFWFDELFTLTIANQPSLHDLWHAVTRGFDSAPPFFYLLERLALKLTGNKEVGLRLPSILAFPCTLICVFCLRDKTRNGELIASSLCIICCCLRFLFHVISIEARALQHSDCVHCIRFGLLSAIAVFGPGL